MWKPTEKSSHPPPSSTNLNLHLQTFESPGNFTQRNRRLRMSFFIPLRRYETRGECYDASEETTVSRSTCRPKSILPIETASLVNLGDKIWVDGGY